MMAKEEIGAQDSPQACPPMDNSGSTEREDESLSFHFPSGLLGFPSCKDFTLAAAEIPGFYWLQASGSGPLAFLMVDPFRLLDDFFVDLPDTDLVHLETKNAPELGVMAIVTLPANSDVNPTANLQGIVALNFKRKIGRQVIIQDSPYGVRWPLDRALMRLAS